ncbi:hypothetical protein B0H17DRAFT_943664 [Mycena rosella]|uniref:Uncharacterized protein n=1 Tax=Mycena rosella TaxID=1033263 RepID=A0AAD7D5H3_MYCRO|nr:hypothetical protein B0H17DRAFT_943664 [Mycena rosella]
MSPPPPAPAPASFPPTSGSRAVSISSESSGSSENLPSSPNQSAGKNDNVQSPIRVEWDRWPDGHFERDFSWQEFHASGELAVNWACEPLGGSKRGSDTAAEWPNGKRTGRRCRGIIRCTNTVCSIIVRPQTRMKGIQKQLIEFCRCGGKLVHVDCGIVSYLYSFAEGFTRIVEDHPTVGPLSLLVGRPGLHGPEASVAEISSVLFNKDRIKSERRAVKHRGNLPTSEVAEFAQFEKDFPGFVIFSQFGAVRVIVMQTPFMVSQLVKNHVILRDAVNGIVSDGAHGYFMERTALLLMSSSYCVDLDCWVPGIMSYANGATQEPFFLHFISLFESMAQYAEKQGKKLTDVAFKNVRLLSLLFHC